MHTIYLDFDGTVLDISGKYWRLHDDLTEELGGPAVEPDAFWQMKRQGARIADIWPDSPKELHERYAAEFVRLIEQPQYLQYDGPHEGAVAALTQLATDYRLVLATMRRDADTLQAQLRDLDLARFFEAVLHSAHLSPGDSGKDALIRQDPTLAPGSSVVVGDTEAEVHAGKSLGMPSVAVLDGLRDRARLEPLGPTHIIASLRELPALLYSVRSSCA